MSIRSEGGHSLDKAESENEFYLKGQEIMDFEQDKVNEAPPAVFPKY